MELVAELPELPFSRDFPEKATAELQVEVQHKLVVVEVLHNELEKAEMLRPHNEVGIEDLHSWAVGTEAPHTLVESEQGRKRAGTEEQPQKSVVEQRLIDTTSRNNSKKSIHSFSWLMEWNVLESTNK